MLPVVRVNNSLRRHPAPTVITTTTTTTAAACDTSTSIAPSGESMSSRVLPPVNVSDVLSRDQLRQHTERIYWRTVQKAATPTHTDSTAANTTVQKDAAMTLVDTADTNIATVSDSVVTASVSDSGCDAVMSQVSTDVTSDTVDTVTQQQV